MNTKGNKELFNEWNKLGYDILLLAGIVQNDMELTEQQIEEWEDNVFILQRRIGRLHVKTVNHLMEL